MLQALRPHPGLSQGNMRCTKEIAKERQKKEQRSRRSVSTSYSHSANATKVGVGRTEVVPQPAPRPPPFSSLPFPSAPRVSTLTPHSACLPQLDPGKVCPHPWHTGNSVTAGCTSHRQEGPGLCVGPFPSRLPSELLAVGSPVGPCNEGGFFRKCSRVCTLHGHH